MRPEDLRFAHDALRPPKTRPPVRVTWLGTAGFAIEHLGTTVLIDPYVTRASLLRCARGGLRANDGAIRRHAPRADAIVAGHTHFDHVLDVPAIARATGAKVYGSTSCAHLCRAAGVPQAQVLDVQDAQRREPVRAEVGPFELRFVASVHSALVFGRVPFLGDIEDCDQVPSGVTGYRCGAVFGVDVRVAGRRIYHLGSANLVDRAPEPGVDLALVCVAGWTTTERFAPRVLRALGPGAVLLSHWDDFFEPMEKGARPLPAMRLPRLVDGLLAEDRSLRIGTLPLLGTVEL